MSIVKNMIEAHQCGIAERPRWLIYGWVKHEGSIGRGSYGIQYWIRPNEDDEFTARKIAQLLNEDKDNVVIAEKSEWHPTMEGKIPIYEQEEHASTLFSFMEDA